MVAMRLVPVALATSLVFACSENRNPFDRPDSTGGGTPKADSGAAASTDSGMAPTGDAGQTSMGDAGSTPGADGGQSPGPDAGGGGGSCTLPARMIVLGDSITACSGLGGKDGARCGPKVLHTHLESTYASGLTYENGAVPGAKVEDVANNQLNPVQGGAGHLLVLLYIGGNDLSAYIFTSDAEAQSAFTRIKPQILTDLDRVLAYFRDTTKFPDGVTFLFNSQYNPFDDCTASPYFLSQVKSGLLSEFNTEIFKLGEDNADIYVTDQYTPFLGHGHHYNNMMCPNYTQGFENWMNDLIHANALGHANFVAEWKKTIDPVYQNCN
jgi:lysophospholipase L1-like esterase